MVTPNGCNIRASVAKEKGVHLLKHISVLDKHNQFLNLISASSLVDLVTICRQVGLENDSI